MFIQVIVTWKVHTHPFSWIFCCYHSFVLYDGSYTCCNNYNTYFDSRPTYIHKTKVRPCWLSLYNWCRWINNIFQLVARNKQIEHILIYFIFLTPYFDKWYNDFFLKSNSIYYTLIDFDSWHTYREDVMNCTEYISQSTARLHKPLNKCWNPSYGSLISSYISRSC